MGNMLKDRIAVITGAGNGIGRAHALAMASQGAKIVVNDIGTSYDGVGSSEAPADKVVEEIINAGGEAGAPAKSPTKPMAITYDPLTREFSEAVTLGPGDKDHHYGPVISQKISLERAHPSPGEIQYLQSFERSLCHYQSPKITALK